MAASDFSRVLPAARPWAIKKKKIPKLNLKKKEKKKSCNIQLRALWGAVAVKGKRKRGVAEQVLKNQTTEFRPVYF